MPGLKGTMKEWSAGKLHSGSAKGPLVTNRKQAIAIGLSEERKENSSLAKASMKKLGKARQVQ